MLVGMESTPPAGMHSNSLAAYAENKTRVFAERQEQVIAHVSQFGPVTDREIVEGLRFGDMNAVRPRVTELVADGVLIEYDHVIDPATNRTVRRTAIAVGQTL